MLNSCTFSLLCLAGALLTPAAGFAQSAPKPEFEVASIKPTTLDQAKLQAQVLSGQMPRLGKHVNALRAEYIFLSLRDLIADAYQVKTHQIAGPEWIGNERFDIVAKMPEGSRKEDAEAMLQALLADRFKLAVHRETKEQPILALVVGKGGHKLKESPSEAAGIDPDTPLKPGEMKIDTPDGQARLTRRPDGAAVLNMGKQGLMTYSFNKADMALRLEASLVTMAGLAEMLTQLSKMGGGDGATVVDMTGLKGNYQIALDLPMADLMRMARALGANVPAPAQSSNSGPADAASDPGGSSVLQSVQSLGLKLEHQKAPMEQLIIDRIEKMPTEN